MIPATASQIADPDSSLRFPKPPESSGRQLAIVLGSALALHIALLMLTMWQGPPAAAVAPPVAGIVVDIVPPGALAARVPPSPAAPIVPAAPDANLPPVQAKRQPASPHPAPPPEPEMIRPTTLLSERRLAERSSRSARLALRTLDDETRVEQLCGLEAMEQVHEWRHELEPDRLVAYALSEPRLIAGGIAADGAAFRSHANWFRMRFRCELSPDRRRVVAFAFAVGEPVSRAEWAERGLAGVH